MSESSASNVELPEGAVPVVKQQAGPEGTGETGSDQPAAPICQHERGSRGAWYWCRKCGMDMSPDVPERHGLYNDSEGAARSCP